MTRLSCTGCGQRYYGPPSPGARCDLCHALLEETGWATPGRRHGMVPLPVVAPPLPAYPQTGGRDLFGTPEQHAGSGR
jgi:hypothetical protein